MIKNADYGHYTPAPSYGALGIKMPDLSQLSVGPAFEPAPERFIFTRSGRRVSASEGVPSLVDIAVALSRTPRFGGHSENVWTVLDHSFFIERLARTENPNGYGPNWVRSLRLAALLHDAHESLTGDIPTPFKRLTTKQLQHQMDARIMREYYPGGYDAFLAHLSELEDLDRRALLAEARVVGPSEYQNDAGMVRHFGTSAATSDCFVLREAREKNLFSNTWDLALGSDHPGVVRFLRLYGELR